MLLALFFFGEGRVDVEETFGEAHLDDAVVEVDADEVVVDEGDEDFGLRLAHAGTADDEQVGRGRTAIDVDDFANVGGLVEIAEAAADKVGHVDKSGGERGALCGGNGYGEAAEAFGLVDGVDALELEDDAAAQEPEVLEDHFARGRANAIGRDEEELCPRMKELRKIRKDVGDQFAASSVGPDETSEERPCRSG
jgi:hypothetical protein